MSLSRNSQKLLMFIVALSLSAAVHSQTAVVAEAVRVEIFRSGEALVLVQLKGHVLSKSAPDIFKQQIHNLQESVLSVLGEREFALRYRYETVAGFSGVVTERGLAALESHPDVVRIQLDMAGQGGLAESVKAIQADQAHDLGFTGKNVVVGVLDSGANVNHPDFNNAIIHQYHFLNQGGDVGTGANDLHGHGSNVAGIITSDGIVAPQGVAPEAKIVVIQVLDAFNRGWVSDWIAGVDYIVANQAALKVQVVNLSLVTDALYSGGNCDFQQGLFADVVRRAKDLGIVIFASSGNTGSTNSMTAPACLSEVVAVGAVYDSDLGREPNGGTYRTLFGGSWPGCFDATGTVHTLACFTSRNESLDLVAPGAVIRSVGLGSGISTFRGTSQAAPHAAGVAALMLEKNPALSPEEIVNILKRGSILVHDPATGLDFPLLNAMEALAAVTTVADHGDQIPEAFALEQNFPNPVQATGVTAAQTTIEYVLTRAETVTLSVYDVRGREVKRLVNGFQPAGRQRVVFDAAGLANGVYFYTLQVGRQAHSVRKMILLR